MRRHEIDLLRTTAIIMMVAYHLLYDLEFFWQWNIDTQHGPLLVFGRSTATLFLLLVGASAVLLRQSMLARQKTQAEIFHRLVCRGLWVLSCGMVVSLATALVDVDTFVRFGILHLIGCSLLMLPAFLPAKMWNIAIGSLLIGIGLLLPKATFASVDYYPLLPWFGVVILGAGLGHWWYVHNTPPLIRLPGWLMLPGRHSLLIYMLHQPLMLALLWLVAKI